MGALTRFFSWQGQGQGGQRSEDGHQAEQRQPPSQGRQERRRHLKQKNFTFCPF